MARIDSSDDELDGVPDASHLAVGGHRLPAELDDVCDAVDVVSAPEVKPSPTTHPP
jgi:hypothetical protein